MKNLLFGLVLVFGIVFSVSANAQSPKPYFGTKNSQGGYGYYGASNSSLYGNSVNNMYTRRYTPQSSYDRYGRYYGNGGKDYRWYGGLRYRYSRH